MTDNSNQTDKTYSQKDIDVERGHAQHFKQELDELRNKFKDVDPQKYKETLTKLDELERKGAIGSEDKINELLAKKEKEIDERYSKRLKELEDLSNGQALELKRERVTKSVLSEAAKLFNADALKLLEPLIEKDGDFENGQIVFRKDGKIRYSLKNPNQPLSKEEYLGELVEQYPSAAKATVGAGTKNGSERVNGVTTSGKILSFAEIKAMPDHGKEYFDNLAKTDPKALRTLLDGGMN